MYRVENKGVCQYHNSQNVFFCLEHLIWVCDVCLKDHKKCKGTIHYMEVIESIENTNIKDVHKHLKALAISVNNHLAQTKHIFMNKIDDYSNSLNACLNQEIDYDNQDKKELAYKSYRYKQTNDEEHFGYFYKSLVDFIMELESSKKLFLNYKIIREQCGLITQYNIHLFREWTDNPGLNVEQVYKASRDGFKSMDFLSKAEKVTPNIVILKTQFGKTIGGVTYTPWRVGNSDYEAVGDSNDRTFIFSVDMEKKFLPKDKRYCMSYGRGTGPVFGCVYNKQFSPLIRTSYYPDLEIVNECNVNKCNYNNIGSCYTFTGLKEEFYGSNDKFLIEEYEVYRIV